MKPSVLVVQPLLAPVLEALAADFTLHRLWEGADPAALAGEIRALATFVEYPVTATLIAELPKLEIIASMGVGVDNIDRAAAAARGIPVTNAPDVLTDCVADLGMALLLAVARRLVAGDRFVRAGKWPAAKPALTTKIGGATLGIVGLGRIGLAVAKRAEAFGLRIVYFGRRRQPEIAYPFYDDLTAMAAASDYLLLACPGGPATRHLVNAAVLDALGPEGVLINIARGSVVDEAALVAALEAGRLGGAGLDVFADEPRVPGTLFALDTVVLQPHVASATQATRIAMGQLMIDNLKAHFAGRTLLTPVTP